MRHLLDTDFAVILLDVHMPEMDGFETARLIRQREKSRYIPIIFLTAIDSDEWMFRGYAVGAVDYLLKPFMPEVLRAKVAVFVELFKKTVEVRRQAEQLAVANQALPKSPPANGRRRRYVKVKNSIVHWPRTSQMVQFSCLTKSYSTRSQMEQGSHRSAFPKRP